MDGTQFLHGLTFTDEPKNFVAFVALQVFSSEIVNVCLMVSYLIKIVALLIVFKRFRVLSDAS
jgi:hypothetical protein